jgi:hypothetical protein
VISTAAELLLINTNPATYELTAFNSDGFSLRILVIQLELTISGAYPYVCLAMGS